MLRFRSLKHQLIELLPPLPVAFLIHWPSVPTDPQDPSPVRVRASVPLSCLFLFLDFSSTFYFLLL